MALIDLTGQRVNKLLVLSRVENVGKQPAWLCECECRRTKTFLGMHLRDKTPMDCGCGSTARRREAQCTHGMRYSREYRSWAGVLFRCTNPKSDSWKWYGGRGITVCERWLSFENFYADMGSCPQGLTIDRKDNDKGYYPDNCRWATMEEQQNNRTNNINVTLGDETKTLKQWAKYFGRSYAVVKARRAKGVTGIDLFAASPRKVYGRTVDFQGEFKTTTQWAAHFGVTYQEMWKRINMRGQAPNGETAAHALRETSC